MKKITVISIFVLAMCGFGSGQSISGELAKIKDIKLLESTRDDVRRILAGYEFYRQDIKGYREGFSGENSRFDVVYTSGDCADDPEEWKVPEWKVAQIEIPLKTYVEIKKSGFDLKKFKRERHYANYSESYVYHDLDSGFLLEVDENKIKRIFVIPPRNKSSLLCSQKVAKKYYYGKSLFRDSKLKDRVLNDHSSTRISELNLSLEELTANCIDSDSTENRNCSGGNREIFVTAISTDPESEDVLVFTYNVSAGKIVGTGAKVIWDLSGVEPGTYTITAGIDDGCGICGPTVTKTVVVKKCPDCVQKQETGFNKFSQNSGGDGGVSEYTAFCFLNLENLPRSK